MNMYTVIEIKNRKVVSTRTATTLAEAAYIMNNLMEKHLYTFDLKPTDVDKGYIGYATKYSPHAFVDVYRDDWDAHVIETA